VEDNWTGIELSDMDLLLERYTTSKIKTEEDLYTISSYGFRWEALASISEVWKTTVISKTDYSQVWTKLSKVWWEINIKHQPTSFAHWTIVTIEDLFYNVPARLKFLKSDQTEFYYCYNYFVDVALRNYEKNFIFKKNDKIIFDMKAWDNLLDRINNVFKKDYSKNLKKLEFQNNFMSLKWYIWDSTMRFGSNENVKVYVNGRPIDDKIIRKAIMDAYHRQLSPWEYPFALIILDIKPNLVDVNVHPRKLQVRFTDSREIFKIVFDTISKTLGENKIGNVGWTTMFWSNNFSTKKVDSTYSVDRSDNIFRNIGISNKFTDYGQNQNLFLWKDLGQNVNTQSTFDFDMDEIFSNDALWDYKLIWQIRDSYIVLQSQESLFYIDQHALAERIAYEKMKKNINDISQENSELQTSLLQPISFQLPKLKDIEEKINQINSLWFDCWLIWETKLVVYSVPKFFAKYQIDLEKLFEYILTLDELRIDNILDWLFATHACKISIKAWEKLSYQQMSQLVKDWFEHIPWMFVCQHGRSFFVQIEKKNIDKLFDR